MNLKSLVYFSLFGFAGLNVNAQNASDELLRINNVPFTVGEFERIYTKNLDLIKDKEQKDIDNYLDLFVLYKLKVAKAYELGIDKKESYVNEFSSHRSQLAEQYLTNQETLEKLAKEAYDRSKYEVKTSHIIFLADEFATPADTLKAYNKALEVRNEILNGKDFKDAAYEYSDDQSAKQNKGDLGYFSVFRMVYPFESGAYNTKVGEISMPIRSEFGYHLIKVEDKRPRQGKRSIAQIYIDNREDLVFDNGKVRIDEVYELLKNGASFDDMVVKYSDDTTTKSTKGEFRNYEPGLIHIDNLDEEVYKLKNVGDFSKPFKSQHGWHIVKLVSDEALPEYDDRKMFYMRKVQSDGRSRILNTELVTHLKEKYNYKVDAKNLNSFIKFVEKNVSKPDYLNELKTNKTLATFEKQKVNEKDFVDFINLKGANFAAIKPIENGVNFVFNDFISERIIEFYNQNLENEFPEFKFTVQEFKEGLLLFDLVDTEVWQRAKNDTLGYTNFYQTHLNEFNQEESIEGVVFESDDKAEIKKVHKIAKKAGKIEKSEMQSPSNNYKVTKGKFLRNDNRLPKSYVLKDGVSEIFEQNGKFYFVIAEKYNQERILELEEAKQNVIYQYQQELDKQWLLDLKNNSEVIINQPVLNQLKVKYNNK